MSTLPLVLGQFAGIPHNTTIKNKYYGVFNKILNKAVGAPTIVTYKVNDHLPIFFLEIGLPLHIDHISSRIDADAQMRARFRALYDVTPTPRLHGVSVMGQRLAFYCMDKATGHVNPNYVAPSNDYMIDIVPAERWDTDITTEEGYQRFMGGYQ